MFKNKLLISHIVIVSINLILLTIFRYISFVGTVISTNPIAWLILVLNVEMFYLGWKGNDIWNYLKKPKNKAVLVFHLSSWIFALIQTLNFAFTGMIYIQMGWYAQILLFSVNIIISIIFMLINYFYISNL